jgi:hypothetical protein
MDEMHRDHRRSSKGDSGGDGLIGGRVGGTGLLRWTRCTATRAESFASSKESPRTCARGGKRSGEHCPQRTDEKGKTGGGEREGGVGRLRARVGDKACARGRGGGVAVRGGNWRGGRRLGSTQGEVAEPWRKWYAAARRSAAGACSLRRIRLRGGGGWHSAASDGSHSVAAWAAGVWGQATAVVTPALRSVGERKTARW